jgi:Ni,Fe-hydrogenase I large subunit
MFSREPSLPGRRVETGLAARRNFAGAGLAARLAAREQDLIETGAAIERLLAGGAAPSGLLTTGLAGNWRYAAVESARGRLYHACRIGSDGRIVDYRIVAPTEWNFHPDGPFVRALLGAEIGAGAAAKRRAERLAFVYDPCIRAEAEIREHLDA